MKNNIDNLKKQPLKNDQIKTEQPELTRTDDIKEAVKKGKKKWMND